MGTKRAQQIALEKLEAFGFGYMAHFRSARCTVKELFVAQVIRASMMQYAKIIIIRPFVMLRDTENIDMILGCLEKVAPRCSCTILDMKSNRNKYEAGGGKCSIIE